MKILRKILRYYIYYVESSALRECYGDIAAKPLIDKLWKDIMID